MIQLLNSNFLSPTTEFRSLSLLLAINETPENSQHALGRLTNLSSSMVNNYIKRFQEEGLINVQGKTNRTRTYHMTPAGRKVLMKQLLSYSAEIVQLYSAVKGEVKKILNTFYKDGIRTVVLYGAAETAEVVHTSLKETSLVVIGIVDSDIKKQGKRFNGFTIKSPEELPEINPDAVVITSFARQEEIFKNIRYLTKYGIEIKKLSVI